MTAEAEGTRTGRLLARVLTAWTEVFTTGSAEQLRDLLADDVRWDGILPGLQCQDRGEVMQALGRLSSRRPRVTRVEAEEFGDRVVVNVHGPDFPENEALAAGAPRSLVFTFDGDTVSHMQSYGSRDEAFAAAQG